MKAKAAGISIFLGRGWGEQRTVQTNALVISNKLSPVDKSNKYDDLGFLQPCGQCRRTCLRPRLRFVYQHGTNEHISADETCK